MLLGVWGTHNVGDTAILDGGLNYVFESQLFPRKVAVEAFFFFFFLLKIHSSIFEADRKYALNKR